MYDWRISILTISHPEHPEKYYNINDTAIMYYKTKKHENNKSDIKWKLLWRLRGNLELKKKENKNWKKIITKL